MIIVGKEFFPTIALANHCHVPQKKSIEQYNFL